MKWTLFFFMSFSAVAEDCFLYQLQGDVVQKTDIRIVVNKGTNSQREFIFDEAIKFDMGPFAARAASGKFVISGTKILKIEEVAHAVPDPLNHADEMVRLKKVDCPQEKIETTKSASPGIQ